MRCPPPGGAANPDQGWISRLIALVFPIFRPPQTRRGGHHETAATTARVKDARATTEGVSRAFGRRMVQAPRRDRHRRTGRCYLLPIGPRARVGGRRERARGHRLLQSRRRATGAGSGTASLARPCLARWRTHRRTETEAPANAAFEAVSNAVRGHWPLEGSNPSPSASARKTLDQAFLS